MAQTGCGRPDILPSVREKGEVGMMLNLDDTIRAFVCCTKIPPDCKNCPEQGPGFGIECRKDVKAEVLRWLKAQEPRVMTLEELPGLDGAFLIETRIKGATVWASWYAEYECYGETVCRMVDIGGEVDDRFKKLYGYEWRCWTSRPTREQREAVKWE